MASENVLASPVSRCRVTACAGTNEAASDSAVHGNDGGVEFKEGSDLYAVELFCGTAGLTAVM